MNDDTAKTVVASAEVPEAPETPAAGPKRFYYEKGEDGRFYALLPSGKRPEIRPIVPSAKLRDIMDAHKMPEVPLVEVQPEGAGIAQLLANPDDPKYKEDMARWHNKYLTAMMLRCLFEGLVVPQDNEWAWLLELTDVPIPAEGRERVRLYAQEMHSELWNEKHPGEMGAFIAAVQQISLPSEAGIAAARRRFPSDVAGGAADELEPTAGGVQRKPRKRRADGG